MDEMIVESNLQNKNLFDIFENNFKKIEQLV